MTTLSERDRKVVAQAVRRLKATSTTHGVDTPGDAPLPVRPRADIFDGLCRLCGGPTTSRIRLCQACDWWSAE